MDFRFRPAFIEAVQGYRRGDFAADVGAGLTVACVGMPADRRRVHQRHCRRDRLVAAQGLLPSSDLQTAQTLVAPTLSIAFLGAIESLLCARVADGMTGPRHDPNQELLAQGAANLVAPLFGGFHR